MNLLPSVDTVVREYVPIVLEAAGKDRNAQRLRELQPVLTIDSVKLACKELSGIEITHVDPQWVYMIEDLTFWTEIAIWAAVRNDSLAFTKSIDRAHTILLDGLDIVNKDRLLN